MLDLLSLLVERAVGTLGDFGYPGVFILSFLDRLTVFLIPAEIVLPAFGVLISKGAFLFWPVFVWVTIGNFLGNLALYFIFLKGGRSFLEKYGRYVLISKHELNHLDRWFLKHGDKIVFVGYLIPAAVRSLIPIPAGLSKMNLSKFSFYTFAGSLPLNFLYLVVGIKAGNNLNKILGYFEKINYFIVGVLVVFVIIYVYNHIKGRHLTHE